MIFWHLAIILPAVSAVDEVHETTAGNFSLGVANPYLKKSDWGWVFDPQGLRWMLNELYGRYNIPLFIAENGLGAVDEISEDGKIHDPYRMQYLDNHVSAMREALEDGVNLMGYTWWGPIDFNKRFNRRDEKALWFYLCRSRIMKEMAV